MFTHRVEMDLNADSFILLSKKIETTIMPFLRIQKGFCQALTTISPERSSALEETHWNTRSDAESYQEKGYPEILRILADVLAKEPEVSIFEATDASITS